MYNSPASAVYCFSSLIVKGEFEFDCPSSIRCDIGTKYYRRLLKGNKVLYKVESNDDFILTKTDCVQIVAILKTNTKIELIVRKICCLKNLHALYNMPFDSSQVFHIGNITLNEQSNNEYEKISANNANKKCFKITYNEKMYVFPIIHND